MYRYMCVRLCMHVWVHACVCACVHTCVYVGQRLTCSTILHHTPPYVESELLEPDPVELASLLQEDLVSVSQVLGS